MKRSQSHPTTLVEERETEEEDIYELKFLKFNPDNYKTQNEELL